VYGFCVLGSLGCDRPVANTQQATQKPRLRQRIESFLSDGRYAEADAEIRSGLIANPQDRWLIFASAESANRAGDLESARDRYQAITGSDLLAKNSSLRIAEIDEKLGDLYLAIDRLREGTKRYVEDTDFQLRLGLRLFTASQCWEAQQHFAAVLRKGLAPQGALTLMLERTNQLEFDEALYTKVLERNQGERRPLLIKAVFLTSVSNWTEALALCDEMVKLSPDFVPGYVLQGRALLEVDPDRLPQWLESATAECQTHPDFWFIQGAWAERRGEYPAAVRCYLESIERDPNFRLAHQNLATVLTGLDRPREAGLVGSRLQELVRVNETATDFLDRFPTSQRAALDLARTLDNAGRLWEAVGWASLALNFANDHVANAKSITDSMVSRLKYDLPLVSDDHNVAKKFRREDWPLPAKQALPSSTALRVAGRLTDVKASPIRIQNRAHELGLDLQYQNGDDPTVPGLWLHQSNGGGVAVIDFDQDGWPDLFFSQAGGPAMDANAPTFDQLFRNLNGRFQNVTTSANVVSPGYGQGVTAGDFNDDGFPDLIASGIGYLRLFKNNGDGSFVDFTEESGLAQPYQWNTSAALADVNSDGFSDIYQACYLSDTEPYSLPCFRKLEKDVTTPCRPTNFTAARDVVFLGDGAGGFRNASSELLAEVQPGRGLGILIADLDSKAGLEVFVANDMSANQLLQFHPNRSTNSVDTANIRGLAFDSYARPQACMGIAAADIDDDGDIDMSVSNFTDESNCLYEQIQQGVFRDNAVSSGIAKISMPMLGFGMQFVDLDNTGDVELIVANGNVDLHPKYGYKMPTQVMSQGEDGKWKDLDATSLGGFFESDHLGRALVVADFNRDFRQDLAMSLLEEPVALLMNETAVVGNSMMIRLIATTGPRDPVGAQVTITIGKQKKFFQLMAGNGFQCSNERTISCGLGDAVVVDELQVRWPNGKTTVQTNLPAMQEHLVIESE